MKNMVWKLSKASNKIKLGFQIIGFHKCKNNQLFPMVFTSWLFNLFYLNNEEISVHARMCTQDIFQFNSIICPIFFAQKSGHVVYTHELMGNPYCNKVLVPTH
jgi:hypothetical protein